MKFTNITTDALRVLDVWVEPDASTPDLDDASALGLVHQSTHWKPDNAKAAARLIDDEAKRFESEAGPELVDVPAGVVVTPAPEQENK